MDKKDCKGMSNAEIRLYVESMKNEFEALKAKVVALTKQMEAIEAAYNDANRELNIRKNILA